MTRSDDGIDDERILTRKKSNYSKSGDSETINMVWDDGVYKAPDAPGIVDRIEKHGLVKAVLNVVDEGWNSNNPYKGNGDRSAKKALPYHPDLKKHPPGLVYKTFQECHSRGFVILNGENPRHRGYEVVKRP